MPRAEGRPKFAAVPYFDHNATTPLADCAREAWLAAQDEAWQNPASPHRAGVRVKLRAEAWRQKMAVLGDWAPERLWFSRGASAAAEQVFRTIAASLGEDDLVALNPTEHPSVRDACERHAGTRVRWLDVTGEGVVTPPAVERALSAGAKVVVVMAANHETGVIQPWAELARLVRAAGATMVCDATQWLGKLPAGGLAATDWGFGSAHKFGGPKGVGVAWGPEGAVAEMLPGGTADYPGIAAMGAAWLQAEEREVFLETERLRQREGFERELVRAVPGVRIVGAGADRLWNTVLALMPEGESSRWVTRLDRRGFEVSSGAACATARKGPAPGLTAIGLSEEETKRVVRISAGASTTPDAWSGLAAAFAEVAPEVRPAAGVVVVPSSS